MPLSTNFVTLSHVWGNNQIFQLRQGNTEDMRRSISFHQLPRVFQDAMYISTELGIKYIWIDSLCIVQDSKEDWVYEARRMGSVYQHAACNIAIPGSRSSSKLGSFLKGMAGLQLNPPLFADCVLDFRNIGETPPFKGLYVRAEETALLPSIDASELNHRAWVAQERALSPGIIHFTPETMWWECNHVLANEAFPTVTIHDEYEQIFRPGTIRTLTVKSDLQDIYAFWRRFIGHYARTALTYEGDRFPAAIGIARTLSEVINDNFVAGFWEGDLIRSLIMRRRGGIIDIPNTCRAPSWSWASLRTSHSSPTTVSHAQPLSGISITVLSYLPGFKTDLDSASLETSDVRGLKIVAPLRRLPVDFEVGFRDTSKWGSDMYIEHDILDRDMYSESDVPEGQAWRLRDPTHLVVLATYKEKDTVRPLAFALLVQQLPEAEGHNTFRKQGLVGFRFLTEDKLEEYFGLQKENEKYIMSPVFGECGFQELVLI